MITFFSFILMFAGCLNWLSIGFLQYDFIAGFFGFQASIFSRIFYILFGLGAFYFVIRIIVNKGSVKVFERKKKQVGQATPPIPSKEEGILQKTNNDFYIPNSNESIFDEDLRKK